MKKIVRLHLALILAFSVSVAQATIISDTAGPNQKRITDSLDSLLSGIDSSSSEIGQVVAYIEAGDRIRAKQLITEILRDNPANVEALHISGMLFMDEKRYKNAQVAFEAALRQNVKNPVIMSKLGVTRILQGERQKGKRILNQALTMDPKNELALSYLAWIAEIEGDYNLAAAFLQKVYDNRRQQTEIGELHVALARLYSKNGQHQKIVDLLQPLIDKKGDDKVYRQQALPYLIDAYLKTSKFTSAGSLLKKSVTDKDIGEVQAVVLEVESLIRQKQYKKADITINKAVKAMPDDAHVIHYSAVQTYVDLGVNNKAIDEMEEVVAILDKSEDQNRLFAALNELNALYVKSARKLDALQMMDKCAKKYPESTMLRYQLAELQASTDQYDKAMENVDWILKKDPTVVDAYYLKGVVARRQKQHMNAEKWFTKTVRMDPAREQAWVQRSGNFYDTGNIEHAIEILQQALKQNETSPVLWFEYGSLLSEAQRHREAAEAYKAVLAYVPTHLPSLDNLAGELLILGNQPRDALMFAERAYQMKPDDHVLQLNYLEALLQNKQYQKLLDDAKPLDADLKQYGRYNYYIGAAKVHLGDIAGGRKNLELASSSKTLDKRYRPDVEKLLGTN